MVKKHVLGAAQPDPFSPKSDCLGGLLAVLDRRYRRVRVAAARPAAPAPAGSDSATAANAGLAMWTRAWRRGMGMELGVKVYGIGGEA